MSPVTYVTGLIKMTWFWGYCDVCKVYFGAIQVVLHHKLNI